MFKIYSCFEDKQSIEDNVYYNKGDYCYTGIHMQQVIYGSLMLVVYYVLVIYFQNFLTLSYPHEKIAWACLPTKIPLVVEILKFAIIMSYQETNIS